MRISALHALRKMMKKERKIGQMIGEMVEVKKMVGMVKVFIEGEKKGKRERMGSEENLSEQCVLQ